MAVLQRHYYFFTLIEMAEVLVLPPVWRVTVLKSAPSQGGVQNRAARIKAAVETGTR